MLEYGTNARLTTSASNQKPKFRVGQSVYVRVSGSTELQGPFLVATVTVSSAMYTLAYSCGQAAVGGREVPENDLVAG